MCNCEDKNLTDYQDVLSDGVLSEEDFYPPDGLDNRILKSNIYNIKDKHEFNNYLNNFFDYCDMEGEDI